MSGAQQRAGSVVHAREVAADREAMLAIDHDERINPELVRPGTARALPLMRFLRRAPSASFTFKPELRYFAAVDTAGHEGWLGSTRPRATDGTPLDGRLLFVARSGDRVPRFRMYIFALPEPRSDELRLLRPPIVNDTVLSHNMDVLLVRRDARGASEMLGVGGQYFVRDLRTARAKRPHARGRDGINLLRASSLEEVLTARWMPWDPSRMVGSPPAIFDGNHTGCYDLMDRTVVYGRPGTCGFDGKMSIAHFKGRYLVYARSNTKVMGGRYVQVVRSERDDPAGPYGPFELIHIDGYDWKGPGNIYFAAVKPHPLLPAHMLLGMFPVNMGRRGAREGNSNGDAMVAIAPSCDGVHFGALTRLLNSTPAAGRTFDHPVDGFVVAEAAAEEPQPGTPLLLRNHGQHHPSQKKEVHFFLHRDVPGISKFSRNASRIVRHTFDLDGLRRITDEARRSLPGCEGVPAAGLVPVAARPAPAREPSGRLPPAEPASAQPAAERVPGARPTGAQGDSAGTSLVGAARAAASRARAADAEAWAQPAPTEPAAAGALGDSAGTSLVGTAKAAASRARAANALARARAKAARERQIRARDARLSAAREEGAQHSAAAPGLAAAAAEPVALTAPRGAHNGSAQPPGPVLEPLGAAAVAGAGLVSVSMDSERLPGIVVIQIGQRLLLVLSLLVVGALACAVTGARRARHRRGVGGR